MEWLVTVRDNSTTVYGNYMVVGNTIEEAKEDFLDIVELDSLDGLEVTFLPVNRK